MADHARRSIREELLTIPGVAGADFDGDPGQPIGVKVQLAPGADPDEVGRRVRRVLAGHGMRSQFTTPAVAPRTPPPPPEPRTVINLAEFEPAKARVEPAADEPIAEDAPEAADAPKSAGASSTPSRDDAPVETPMEAADSQDASVFVLRNVTVTQDGTSATVAVSGGGRRVERLSAPSEGALDRALLAAVCELLGVSPEPTLIDVTMSSREGVTIVSVLVDDGMTKRAGAAVDRGIRAWAVARALWSAVSGPA